MKWIFSAILLLIVGAIFQLSLLVYAMYVLLAVLLASRYLAREWIENLEADRECNREVAEIGEELMVVLTIRNRGRLPIPWLLVEDSLPIESLTQNPPRLRAEGSRLNLLRLRSKKELRLEYRVRFLMRGYYQIGPLLMESGDLFGLHRRYRVATEPQFVLVPPKVVPLQGYDLASRLPIGEIRMTHRLFEDPTRLCGVRSFERGDPLNRIHWRATARTGSIQSKVYEPSTIAGATLLLDMHCNSHKGRGDVVRRELAITTVASLAHTLHQMGQRVGLVTNGRDAADRIREEGWNTEFRTRAVAKANLGMHEQSDRRRPVIIETRRTSDQLTRILETLARLELTDGLEFPQLVVEAASRLPRNATVVAVLTDVPPETAVALINLRRQGYAVTAVRVVFDEPQTPDWARGPDWAGWLLAGGVEVKRVESEAALSSVCADRLIRSVGR